MLLTVIVRRSDTLSDGFKTLSAKEPVLRDSFFIHSDSFMVCEVFDSFGCYYRCLRAGSYFLCANIVGLSDDFFIHSAGFF